MLASRQVTCPIQPVLMSAAAQLFIQCAVFKVHGVAQLESKQSWESWHGNNLSALSLKFEVLKVAWLPPQAQCMLVCAW